MKKNYLFILIIVATRYLSVGNAQVATLTVSSTPTGKIPQTFMGLSMESKYAQRVMGSSTTAVDPIFRNLIRNLSAYGSGPLIIRVGGGSTDIFTDNPASPAEETIQPFIDLYQAQGTQFILGINAKAGDLNIAKKQAGFYALHMPTGSLLGLEIGNEPENYGLGSGEWSHRLSQWASGVRSVAGNIKPIVNCAYPSCNLPASRLPNSNNANLLAIDHARFGMFTTHYYTGGGGNQPADWLLRYKYEKNIAAIQQACITAHDFGLACRIGEMNSLANGGQIGISDSFQSALWLLNTLFEMAASGVDGVNIQGFWVPNADHYSPAVIDVIGSGRSTTYALEHVYPIYYGMLMFQQATGRTAQLYKVSIAAEPSLSIKAWATIDNEGTERLIIINMDENKSARVIVPDIRAASAFVSYLRAPSYQSSDGVTLAGQTFDNSRTGLINGHETLSLIKSASNGFSISLPVTSAALVTFQH